MGNITSPQCEVKNIDAVRTFDELFPDREAIESARLCALKVLTRMGARPEEVESAIQDAFVQALRCAHTFEGKSKVNTWFCEIAKRCLWMILRSESCHPSIAESNLFKDDSQNLALITDDKDSPLEEASRNEIVEKVRVLIHQASPTLELLVVGGLSIAEIAEVQHVAIGTVKSRLNAGRAKFRELCEHSKFVA